jgi:cysteine desulfurase/selenocysteine lyase
MAEEAAPGAAARDASEPAAARCIGGRNIQDIRADFPILSRRIGERQLVYLDNAATSQKPRAVIEAVSSYYETVNSNVHRALHTLGEEATAAYERSRSAVARFIGAARREEIVFTHGATEAINLVAASWGKISLKPGDVVLLTEMEHHSNLVPWQLAAEERGCSLRFIPVAEDGSLDLSRLEETWTDRVRLVALTHVSNVLGTVNDVKRIADFAHARGALVLLDGAQSVPHMPVKVDELGCDFLAFSGHKACGPMGIGVLYARGDLLEKMPPYMGGGEMIRAVWLHESTWNDPPHKFEAGTPNVEGAVGFAAAISYLEALGMESIAAYEEHLARHAVSRLSGIRDLTLYSRASRRTGVLSFNLEGIHPHDVAQLLDRDGIAIRAGHHCAQPLMRKFGVAATARASLSFYNTIQEIDLLAESIEKTRRFFS